MGLYNVKSVKTVRVGSMLTAEATAGDSVISVEALHEFAQAKQLVIGGETTYYETDWDNDCINLIDADREPYVLAETYAEDTGVFVVPTTYRKTAFVGDDHNELEVEVPRELWSALPDGPRTDADAEWVTVENDTITEIIGYEADTGQAATATDIDIYGVLFGGNRIAGRYYSTPVTWGYIGSIPVAADTIYAIPFIVAGAAQSFDQMLTRVYTLKAGGLMRIGIYSDTNGAPGDLILDAGEVDASSTGLKTLTISQALSPGLHWLVLANKIGAGQAVWGVGEPINFLGWSDLSGTGGLAGNTIYNAFTYAALPATFPLTAPGYTEDDYPPAIFLRKA